MYRDGKIILNGSTIILLSIHQDDLNHQEGYLELERSADCKYHNDKLREAALFVCASCEGCSIQRMVLLSDGPMPHLSIEYRACICRTLGLSLGRKPVSLNDYKTIDSISHETASMECALGRSCCFIDCFHYLLTGNRVRSWGFQRELKEQQKKQSGRLSSFYYPYHDPKQTLLGRGIIESNMHILAELLGVHIYEYRSELNSTKWNYVAGHQRGQTGQKLFMSGIAYNPRGDEKGGVTAL